MLRRIGQLSLPITLLASPNLYLAWERYQLGETEKIAGSLLLVLFCCVFLLVIPSFFRFRLRRYLLILSPLILLIPLVILNISLNKQFPNHWLLLTTWYDINDAIELFKEQGIRMLLLPVLFLIYIVWVLRSFSKDERLKLPTRLAFIITFILLLGYDFYESRKAEISYKQQFLNRLDLVYPWGILRDFYQVFEEVNMIEEHEEMLWNFSFNAKSSNPSALAETYILFLGETARFQNWSLNGYERHTNPMLEQRDNLIVYSDMTALASTTVKAIPLMLTKAGPENFREAFKQRSFITAFKEADFKVYWLSNLHRFGEHDTNTSIYAEEADTCIYNDKIEPGEKYKLDHSLLPLYDEILMDKPIKKLIIIHTLGSHFNYTRRYPSEFDKYLPSGKSEKTKRKYSREELVNAYDNSVLYTDYIINEIIKSTEKEEGNALLWYVPDHGENLLDDHRRLHLHGVTNYFDLHVPSFFWYNDSYQDSFPNMIAELKNHKDQAASFESLFHTLPDLAGLEFKELNSRFCLSDSNYRPHKRVALSLDDRVIVYDKLEKP